VRDRLRVLVLVLGVIVAACVGGSASPSPGGFQEVFEALARRGATVTRIVSGDTGCADPTLVGNAVSFHLRLDDGVDREVHLFGFRDGAALDAAEPRLDECMRQFLAKKPSAEPPGAVGVGPFYAFASQWSESAGDALGAALGEAVGGS
jgi:hypothetical protein